MFKYMALKEGEFPESLPVEIPFKCLMLISGDCTSTWQNRICLWLVQSGCLYAMTWGDKCEQWHDCIDDAYSEYERTDSISEHHLILTTWHDDESLSDVMFLSKIAEYGSSAEIKDSLILDIGAAFSEDFLRRLYERT